MAANGPLWSCRAPAWGGKFEIDLKSGIRPVHFKFYSPLSLRRSQESIAASSSLKAVCIHQEDLEETDRQTERDRDRETETGTERDRDRGRQRHGQRDRDSDRETETESDRD